MKQCISLVFLPLISLTVIGCRQQQNDRSSVANNYVVMAIEGDVDNFNPLFSEDVTAGEINDLFYPALTGSRFDDQKGSLEYYPLLAKSWEYANTQKDITFHLRTNAKWSDGVAVTARDVQSSYVLYSDTVVASVRQTSVEGLRKTEGVLDIKQAVEVVNDSTVCFHFDHPYPGQLFDAGLPILPAHVFEKLPRTGLREDSVSRHPLSSGPYSLRSWKPLEEIKLVSNSSSSLPFPGKLSELIFRVIPDYHARLMQLQSGEIDVLPYINVEDALALTDEKSKVEVVPMGERFYDAINWNNIDPAEYAASHGKRIRPHALFGGTNVRRALTLAINRKEIIDSYLHSFGKESVGPISPIFRWAYNDTLKPLSFDPQQAAMLLEEAGWRDTDGDRILDKEGRKFSFTLKVPSGNQLRSTIATLVQRQLRSLHIDMKIEQMERSAFWEQVMDKQFDACIAGFSVPLQMQLDELWGSDLQRSRFNLTSFRNKQVDNILAAARAVAQESENAAAWKEFQVILHREQPCTFLYWLNDLVAINKRVRGTQIGVLGITHRAGEWYVEHTGAAAAQK